jgi:prepilin-type N-terminal cleavage/methylation domain-containing protein
MRTNKAKKQSPSEGFTLIELLLVVAILAILSTVVVVVINPAELLKQTRDAIRLSDLGAINKTLSISQVNAIPLGSSTIIYISIPDTSAACANLGLPTPPPGWSYQCAPSSAYRNANGTGWIPVNFNLIPGGSSLGALPIDPVNTTNSGLYYLYVPGSPKWAIAASLESQKYLPKAANDGGYDPGRYEIGTDLSLIVKAEGLVGWWKFDDGSGTAASDSSGNGNNSTLNGGVAWA